MESTAKPLLGPASQPALAGQRDTPAAQEKFLNVAEAAKFLGVSQSSIRRHLSELPVVRLGRSVRLDSELLKEHIKSKILLGKSLKPERKFMPSRYQRGSVFQTGKKVKVWYGMFREDIRTPDGQSDRRQRMVRLGTVKELPTKNAARNKLADILRESTPATEMTFQELTERWQEAEGPTMKPTTLSHYRNALRAYVLPSFKAHDISTIKREDVQIFLASQAKKYSKSVLRSMRVVLSLTLGWAAANRWIQANPCKGIKLPQQTGGRQVIRTVLTPEQVNAIAAKLEEPYATLVLFLAASGLRIGEAIAVKWSDFDGDVLIVSRRIAGGAEDTVKTAHSNRKLPISSDLIERMRQLGEGEYIFRSKAGTPVNPGNALKRYVRPAATALGISLGGWHDFRHSLTTAMRRAGVHPKVISGILGHARVSLALNVYDHADVEDFKQPLANVAEALLPKGCYEVVMKSAASA